MLSRLKFQSFHKSREFVIGLNLKNRDEWRRYCKSGKKPDHIPSNPDRTYQKIGWRGYGDWLGTGRIAPQLKQFLEFNVAREFAISLRLTSLNEWKKYAKSTQRPSNIPANPNSIYKTQGWRGYGDWLGTGRISPRLIQFRDFTTARNFVRELKLKNIVEWRKYCKSGNKPKDIPTNPGSVYHKQGWIGYGDWLGTNTIATRIRKFRSYAESRQFVHTLKLENSSEWRKYCKSGNKPKDIPSAPDKAYRNQGWKGHSDWLGIQYHSNELK